MLEMLPEDGLLLLLLLLLLLWLPAAHAAAAAHRPMCLNTPTAAVRCSMPVGTMMLALVEPGQLLASPHLVVC